MVNMSGSSGSDARGTSYFQKTYADPSAGDIDLISEGGTGQPCRWVRVGGAGDLTLELPVDGSPSVTIPGMVVGEQHLGAARKILAATTATNITVYW